MAGARGAGVDQAAHVVGETGHVERAVLHADIHVVGPGAGIFAALRVSQHVTGMRTVVVDRLTLRQQFDCAVDTVGHVDSLHRRQMR